MIMVLVVQAPFFDYEYVGVSSENPHKFAVSKYVSEKFIKNLDTLK